MPILSAFETAAFHFFNWHLRSQVRDPRPAPGGGKCPAGPEGEGRLRQLQASALQHAGVL